LSKLKPDVRPGDAVGIVGIGGVGHLAVQFAKAVGYRTVAVDSRTTGCDLACEVPESLKPDLVVDLSKGDGDKLVQDFTNGEGLAGIVVCTDAAKANAWGLRQLGNKGVMVPLGLPKDGFQFDAETIIFRELSIRGSYVAGADDVAEMLKVAGDHNVASHLTIMKFDEIPNVVDRYLDASIKGRLVIQIAKE
jgi:D-arabinose 1-dehydrogenase-like Zn-dependent alcohol dehydrogenase